MENPIAEKRDPNTANVRNRKIGIFFIVGPFIGLVFVLTIWTVTSFVMASRISATSKPDAYYARIAATPSLVPADAPQKELAAIRIINVALGFFGIIFVVGIVVGIPVGLIFLGMKEPTDEDKKKSP